VTADRDRVQQVLENLLSNAVKFSRRGEKVDVRLSRRNGAIRLEVEDRGIGIPPSSREKVFGKFAQVDSSDRRSHGGTGLGLAIAQEIMTAHGGTIDYTSRLGEGTTFIIEFPIED
jgi:signal transduction histidine kinase